MIATVETYKTIFQGWLEFDSQKSFDKVYKMYLWRMENYHRRDILLTEEDLFTEGDLTIQLPKFITQATFKSYENTVSLLEYLAQYAVAGNMGTWMTKNGKILRHGTIEPTSQKATVESYKKGLSLTKESGKEEEALNAFDKAISKYSNHAQAYERRAYVNFMLEKHHDAIRDYTKSINIYDGSPEPYYGRAYIHMLRKDYDLAVPDFERAIKLSIPLQSIYWKARRLKGECFYVRDMFREAQFDFKVYAARTFVKNDPNAKFKRLLGYRNGLCLKTMEDYEKAFTAFENAMEAFDGLENVSDGELYYQMGICLRHLGKNKAKGNFRKAAELGHEAAAEELKKKKRK